jgi:hypothetical protein
MVIQDSSGHERQVGPGEAFEVSPGHDAWVMGDVPCVALDFAHIANEESGSQASQIVGPNCF